MYHTAMVTHTALASKPGVVSVRPGDEGNFSGHFRVVDPSAGLKVFPLFFPAGLFKIALALHRFNDSILGQKPVRRRCKTKCIGYIYNTLQQL